DPAATPRVRATLRYYLRLLGGLYVFLALTCVLFLLPRRGIGALGGRLAADDPLAGPITRTLTRPQELAAIRVDAVLALTLYGGAFWLYGAHAHWLALALALRALWVSLNDNAYHYGTPAGDDRHGLNLRASTPARWLLLNFNLHGVHHLDPGCPWTGLRRRFEAGGSSYDGTLIAAFAAQLRGPVPAQASSASGSGSGKSSGSNARSPSGSGSPAGRRAAKS
ncbi:MAG TPA: fatty acid desaturase, partial [Pelomicrobium sp.]|nr:fatty acid desaturase [Pelomicrobium sp.]